jgi:hypothetical protein
MFCGSMAIKLYLLCRTQTGPIKIKHLSLLYYSLNVEDNLYRSLSVNLTLSYLSVIHITDNQFIKQCFTADPFSPLHDTSSACGIRKHLDMEGSWEVGRVTKLIVTELAC